VKLSDASPAGLLFLSDKRRVRAWFYFSAAAGVRQGALLHQRPAHQKMALASLSAPTPAESLTFRKVHPLPQNRVEKHTPPCQPTQELLIIKFLRAGQNS
jgi:hypothetical protein